MCISSHCRTVELTADSAANAQPEVISQSVSSCTCKSFVPLWCFRWVGFPDTILCKIQANAIEDSFTQHMEDCLKHGGCVRNT